VVVFLNSTPELLAILLDLIFTFSDNFICFWILEKYQLYWNYVMLIVLCNNETRYYNVNSSLSKISIQYSPTIRWSYHNDKLI